MVTEPIARRDDPLTSYLAGDRPQQRIAARHWVMHLLAARPEGVDDTRLCLMYDLAVAQFAGEDTPFPRVAHSRLRTARDRLKAEGMVVFAGDGTSLSGNRAQKWRLSDSTK